MSSQFLEGYTKVRFTLPHTGRVVECEPLPLPTAAPLLRLFDQTRVSDGALADLIEQFPAAIGVAPTEFDGLTPAEFVKVVGDFFSVRRDQAPATTVTGPATPGPSAP